MKDEPRYTLREAQLELNREKCARQGHDYEIFLQIGLDGPDGILCRRCGRSWPVGAEKTPD